MSTFEIYQSEVEVTGLAEGMDTWEQVDLAPFLEDPTAKAVILRGAYDSGNLPLSLGFRGINDPQIKTVALGLLTNKYVTTCVSLAGGTVIEIFVGDQSTPRVWITGEVHDHAEIYNAAIHYSTPEEDWEQFIDRQPTPQGGDVLADIGQVIVRALVDATASANFVIREKGSTNLQTPAAAIGGMFWYVVGLDENGFYQTFTDGSKVGFPFLNFYEVGYILKTGNVVTVLNVSEENFPVNHPNFDTIDLSTAVQPVDEGAIAVGIEWFDTDPITVGRNAFIRAVGAASGGKQHIFADNPATQVALVNELRQIEYRKRNPTAQFSVWWWEVLPPIPVITSTPSTMTPVGLDYNEALSADGSPTLVWDLLAGPSLATINPSTGLISWTPPESNLDDRLDFTAVVTNFVGSDTLSWQVLVTPPQLTGKLVAEPVLIARTETTEMQALAAVAEPVLTAKTKAVPVLKAKTEATVP
ncbi:hypothetical protein LCGC14_1567120 [marine sediment metagenome]|uniref:Uncharacterized protein n=1 Tax=marine sediment metagenome TaxID=412755 RepID=A0A0F9J6Z7_9ZZZZ